MAHKSIPVDLTNPGQVFACLGFLETANMLLGETIGGFDWYGTAEAYFHMAAPGSENPFVRVLRFLDEAIVTSLLAPKRSANSTEKKLEQTWEVKTRPYDDSDAFPYPDPGKPDTLPACLSDDAGHSVIIDHWGDRTHRDNVKFWAGSGGKPGTKLAEEALGLIRGRVANYAHDPFSLNAPQSSSFRFDWRRDYVSIDVGFSPNEHRSSVVMQGYPIVEILAAIGLTNARPVRREKLEYRYGVAGLVGGNLYDAIFLRASLGVEKPLFPGMRFRLFVMHLAWPGKEGQARCITDVIEET